MPGGAAPFRPGDGGAPRGAALPGMREFGAVRAGMINQRWSWPLCGTVLLTGSMLVWLLIARALAHWLG